MNILCIINIDITITVNVCIPIRNTCSKLNSSKSQMHQYCVILI